MKTTDDEYGPGDYLTGFAVERLHELGHYKQVQDIHKDFGIALGDLSGGMDPMEVLIALEDCGTDE